MKGLSRREFIFKRLIPGLGAAFLAGAAPGVLSAKAAPESPIVEPVEEEGWAKQHFFEDIDSMNPELMARIEDGLSCVGKLTRDTNDVESQATMFHFSREEWLVMESTVRQQLRRVVALWRQIKIDTSFNQTAREIVKKDFYELGSAIWVILRAVEKYRNDPKGFCLALGGGSSILTSTLEGGVGSNQTEPFIDQEILDIDARWMDDIRRQFSGRNFLPAVSFLLTGGICALPTASSGRSGAPYKVPWYLLDKDKNKLLGGYHPDPQVPGRPQETPVGSETNDPGLEKTVHLILEKYGLERIASAINIVRETEAERISLFSGTTDPNRVVELTLPDNYQDYPQVLEGVTIHEAIHVLMKLLPYLTSDALILKHRAAIEEILQIFRPQKTLRSLFQPDSIDRSKVIAGIFSLSHSDWFTMNDFATITQYATMILFPPESRIKEIDKEMPPAQRLVTNISECIAGDPKMMPDSYDFYPAPTLVFDLVPLVEVGSHRGQHFSDFFLDWFSELRQRAIPMSNFERFILQRIADDPRLFDAESRYFYYQYYDSNSVSQSKVGQAASSLRPEKTMTDYFREVVLPMVIADAIQCEPAKFTRLLMELCDTTLKKKTIANMLRVWVRQPSDEHTDMELLPEVFEHALRRSDPTMANAIPEAIWQRVETEFRALRDDLIGEGLAQNIDTMQT
jgi:hypothetical protein